MSKKDLIEPRVREDLVIIDHQGREDVFLRERSDRLADLVEKIGDLPEATDLELDRTALRAAAIYHDAGWAIQCRQGIVTRAEILVRATTDAQRELAVALLESRLSDVLEPSSLQAAVEILRQTNRRDTAIVEAHILSDAVNLDEMGPLLLWVLVRRHALEGKGVQAALESWNARKEYGYWRARIENFHFEPVRQLAKERLACVEQYMAQLSVHNQGTDFGGSRFPGPPPEEPD